MSIREPLGLIGRDIVNKRVLKTGYVSPQIQSERDAMKDADIRLVKQIAAKLERLHPGHYFRVTVEHRQRIIKFELPPLLETPHCYVLPIAFLHNDPNLTWVTRAAGEILERFQMPRNNWSQDDFMIASKALPFAANRRKGYKVPG